MIVTPKQMVQHIREKKCIKMTTLDKANFNKDGYNTPWDNTTDINICWKYIGDLTKQLNTRDIATSDDEMFRIAVAQMWESNYFIEEILIK